MATIDGDASLNQMPSRQYTSPVSQINVQAQDLKDKEEQIQLQIKQIQDMDIQIKALRQNIQDGVKERQAQQQTIQAQHNAVENYFDFVRSLISRLDGPPISVTHLLTLHRPYELSLLQVLAYARIVIETLFDRADAGATEIAKLKDQVEKLETASSANFATEMTTDEVDQAKEEA